MTDRPAEEIPVTDPNPATETAVDFDTVDFFTAPELIDDPYPYFDHLRSKCPVLHQKDQNVYAVSGYDAAMAGYRDEKTWSSATAVVGPLAPLPFEVTGDDITPLIQEHLDEIAMGEFVVCQDPPQHSRTRGLLNRLLKPKRFKENEEYTWSLADQQLDTFLAKGSCEWMADYAHPFAGMVIADLLGVPEEDRLAFRQVMANQNAGQIGETLEHNPIGWLDAKFTEYLTDRRATPRADILTELAEATYEDGTVPPVKEVVNLSTFLFAAGQETTTKLLSTGLRVMAERPDIQEALRADRSRIPNFLEECLRMESPVKSHFRLATRDTELGGVPVPIGSQIMLMPGACNRDPEKFEDPHEFKLDRHNVREQIAFGRGIHSCPGAPLARAESRITMNRVLDRMADIRIDEAQHGPEGDRRYSYDPTFIMRGLSRLHLTFTAID